MAHVALNECDMFHALVDFGGRYIHLNSRDDTEYNRICSKQIDMTVRSFFIKIIMMTLSFNGAMIGPAYGYYMYGSRTTMTNVRIPFADEFSDIELMANIVLASLIGFHGFFWLHWFGNCDGTIQ